MRVGTAVYYLYGDHLGSTSLTTDATGGLVSQARFTPFGEVAWDGGTVSPTDFEFTGQRAERGFGLMDYNARFYSNSLGRFISPDSIIPGAGNPMAWDRFSYAYNNPLYYTDPSGHSVDCSPYDANCRGGKIVPRPRVYFLNAISYGGNSPIRPSSNPASEQGYMMYKLQQTVGADNVTHIPIYYEGNSRLQMLGEMFEVRSWSDDVAAAIVQDLADNPLEEGQALIIVGNSGGGTIAVEALDLLAEQGVYVDQIILRGSPVQEESLENVGGVDYITSHNDPYYSYDSNPYDAVEVAEYSLDFEGHRPPTDAARKEVGNLIAYLVNQAR